jgi:polysaccharide pyruvyl transferase WcaK-like protein
MPAGLSARRSAYTAGAQGLGVAIWGYYHGGNLGDELVVATIAAAARQRIPGVRLFAVSLAPADSRERHGLESFPLTPQAQEDPTIGQGGPKLLRSRLRRSVRRLVPGVRYVTSLYRAGKSFVQDVAFDGRALRFLWQVDTLVVAGSGQLIDKFYGPFGHPYSFFRWCWLARLAGARVCVPSVGAGPLAHPLSRFFVRHALGSVTYISVRDNASRQVLQAAGVQSPIAVVPDMAWGSRLLQLAADEIGERPRPGSRIVGLNVLAHEDPRYWPRGDRGRFAAYLARMADFAHWLLANGYRVRLFSSQNRADQAPARELLELLHAKGVAGNGDLVWAIDPSAGPGELIDCIAGCDLVVGARYHSLLVPLALGIPAVALAYNHKTVELMANVGLGRWCFDIDSVTVEELCALVRRAWQDWPIHRQEVARIAERNRTLVERQFDLLFGKPEL